LNARGYTQLLLVRGCVYHRGYHHRQLQRSVTVERFRPALASTLSIRCGKSTKLDQPRLLSM
jgi:hypothetical protein